MSYIFDLDKIQEGDILLINTSAQISDIMERQTGSRFHHAMLYVGASGYIHSDKGPGVQAGNTQRRLFETAEAAIALRLRSNDDYKVILHAVDFVRDKVGTEYSFAEARKVIGAQKGETLENRQFCTRLVAQAYSNAGAALVENPDFCSPQELIESEKLIAIEGILIPALEEDIKFATETDTILDQQIAALNDILSKARELTGQDIQSLNQITEYLLEHREHDQAITKIVEDGPYLHFWKNEKEKYPCRYNVELFLDEVPKSVWPTYLLRLEEVYDNNIYRYRANLIGYQELNKEFNLAYLAVHVKLYQDLVNITEQMGEVLSVIKAHLS